MLKNRVYLNTAQLQLFKFLIKDHIEGRILILSGIYLYEHGKLLYLWLSKT